ncbi:MAG: DEAD/DEAH box helicase [Anaerolineae bacterium]|nr:DEAD/DEAH box helicase [Anaerolineae bacterium]
MGSDLRYWGLAAKFGLELMAGQRFLPAVRAKQDAEASERRPAMSDRNGGPVRAVWQPALDEAQDAERFAALAAAMPDACRAVLRERADLEGAGDEALSAASLLQSFLEALIDGAVRDWIAQDEQLAEVVAPAPMTSRFSRPMGGALGEAWWRALRAPEGEMQAMGEGSVGLDRFYQAWRSWSQRAKPESEAAFRICFRLEPPEFDAERAAIISPHWTLRYFLQATDDPSLLVPARDVWRERGDTLSFLNRRFDQPQEKLLEGLGLAARFCAPVRRSLSAQGPEAVTLSDKELYTFLRETVRLLQEAGFGVLVPPWWNRPDARLRARVRLSMDGNAESRLGLRALVSYDWQLALGDEVLTPAEFEQLAALKTPLVQVRGRWVLLQPDQVEAAIAFWEKRRLQGDMPLSEALSLALGVDEALEGLTLDGPELDERLSEMVEALSGEEPFGVLPSPPGLVGQLRPYQVLGYSWLAFLRRYAFGACLADDMGLGKTIQAIALLLHERAQDPGIAPALVVCPTSVVGNWRREVERFAPGMRVMVHHGSGRAEGRAFVEGAEGSDLVISTYGLVRRDIDDLTQVHWSTVILDEAQNIKNPATKQARAARRLVGDHRVALTGTPVENRLSELWSIMAFLNPGYLGSFESFRRSFALPIERYHEGEAAERLRKMVRPFILRRLKTDPKVIQDLPEKFEYRVYCNLTREQATLYEAIVQSAMGALSETAEDGAMRRRGLVLAMLMRLKQVCNHPALYLGDGSSMGERSGKLNRLTEMLEEALEVGDRALVFTQFASMGHLLQAHLQHTFGAEVLFLHGGTPQHRRDQMLARFQQDEDAPSIFVLSLKAGGLGLNLMRANHVFHFDRWWNPAVEDQATDRAFRIGQTRDVQVHKFICVGTLEERIDELIESKRELAENIVGDGEGWLTELSSDELRELVRLRAEAIETE